MWILKDRRHGDKNRNASFQNFLNKFPTASLLVKRRSCGKRVRKYPDQNLRSTPARRIYRYSIE